jgi:hypothetical protein
VDVLLHAGLVVGAAGAAVAVLRYVTQLVVVVWSLRADDAGRKHAVAVLRVLNRRDKPGRFRGG